MRTPINAATRDFEYPEATLAETVHHEIPRGDSRPDREGINLMPHATEKAAPQQRYTFSSGARPLDGFTIKRAIGRGGFGEVYYATSDAGKEVALKLITRNLEIERRGVVQCMNLKSPHLVAIHDMKQNDDGDSFVIMEFVSGPSLAQILAQHPAGLPAAEIRMWLKGLVDGVAYLHDHGIVHRDLKPANLFLEDGVVKIGDYGLSKAITGASRDPGHSECVGTCHYMAPETSTGKYHKPIDVYAIGVILYEMVTGRVPFDGESVGEVLMKHLTSRPDLSVLPEPFKAIVSRALAKDPNHRPQRVTDLLLPGDARKEPELRFIGEKNAVVTPAELKLNEKHDEILRITDEAPVFYIGPETRPAPKPQRTRAYTPWVWVNPAVRAMVARRSSRQTPVNPPRTAQAARPVPPMAPVAAPRPAPVQVAAKPAKLVKAPLPPLGPPPQLPTARIRLAELTSSMFWAAPVAALGSVLVLPITSTLPDAPATDPRVMALVFGTSLLAAWMSLVTGKLWEGKSSNSRIVRRFLPMILGALVGIASFGLAEWTNVGPTSHRLIDPQEFTMLPPASRSLAAGAAEYAAFFGLVGLIAPGWKAATRNRKSRLRVLPFIWTGLTGAALCAVFPAVMPAGAVAVAIAAFVTPLVSPFSREAANYAREAARRAA